MDLRESKSRLILIVAVLGAVLVIAVASCGGGGSDDSSDGGASQSDRSGNGEETASGDDSTGSEAEQEVLAEVTSEENITLTFTQAEREEGGFLTIEGTLYNGSDDTFFASQWAGEEEELADNGFSMAGASLVAQAEGKRYLILRDTTGRCLCTNFGDYLEPGETVSWFAQFPEPEASTSEVQFQIADMPTATLEIQ